MSNTLWLQLRSTQASHVEQDNSIMLRLDKELGALASHCLRR
jgi:hypothetical protein